MNLDKAACNGHTTKTKECQKKETCQRYQLSLLAIGLQRHYQCYITCDGEGYFIKYKKNK